MSVEQMEGTVRAAVAAWNAGDPDGYHAMYDPSLVHHGLSAAPLDDAGNRAFYAGLATAFPGCRLVVDDMVAEEDRLALRLRVLGEHKGEFIGVAATGRPIQVDGQTILRFENGLVVERWTIADLAGLTTQLDEVARP